MMKIVRPDLNEPKTLLLDLCSATVPYADTGAISSPVFYARKLFTLLQYCGVIIIKELSADHELTKKKQESLDSSNEYSY